MAGACFLTKEKQQNAKYIKQDLKYAGNTLQN